MGFLTVHYHELALKRGNRRRFEQMLRDNVGRALRDVGPCKVVSASGRLLAEVEGGIEAALERATRVSGVAYVLRVLRGPRDLEAVGRTATAELQRLAPAHFRITARRVDKDFPHTSVEVDRLVGAMVHEATGIPVRLRGAEQEVFLTILPEEILIGFDKRNGPGGLPVGTGGKVAVLLSGGIDSPVAAWRMINRGCRADLVHFHSAPLVDRTTQEKARDLAEELNRWQFHTRLFLVPLAPVQTEVRVHCPEPLRVVLYRRFMMRIAERLARRRGCGALVTGESLGQVASQTLENLATVDAVAAMPVLRPLVGTDKQEIIEIAQRLGTYDISVRKDQDCCRLFVPAHPATHASPREAEEAEGALDVEALVSTAVDAAETVDFGA